MSLDSAIPKPFRPVIVLVGGIAAVLAGAAWVESRIDAKVDERAAIIATKVMASMSAQLQASVSEAASRGANEAVLTRVAPLEQRVARAEGWIESRQGRVEVTTR